MTQRRKLRTAPSFADPTLVGAIRSAPNEGTVLGFNPQTKPYEVFTDKPTEIVVGIVGPLGTDGEKIRRLIGNRLEGYGYNVKTIRISQDIIPELAGKERIPKHPKYERAKSLIDHGNLIRKESKNHAILALAAAAKIAELRPKSEDPLQRNAYVLSSLKHQDEVAELRRIYANGFYLFAVHTEKERRIEYLAEEGEGMTKEQATELVKRDEHEVEKYGQHTRDTFHLADFFLADEQDEDKLRFSIWRCLDLVFANPTITPTFNEFAMFMAFSASLHSADMSRQVGAVIARDDEILATGANDCPRSGGGQYWPLYHKRRVQDFPDGRDYMRGFDSNSREKMKLIESIADKFDANDRERVIAILQDSPLRDITEYGRVVHAEMAALLACSKSGTSSANATLFCTTFPCHNCAKHIIAAGISEVVYIEPYPKSKALEFHHEAATISKGKRGMVRFKPFIGVGPRQFFDLFSMDLSSGRRLIRKEDNGDLVTWNRSQARPRVPMLPIDYMEFEALAAVYLDKVRKK